MNREIKFRIWDIEAKHMSKGISIHAHLERWGKAACELGYTYPELRSKERLIFLQYIGQKDKNGKEMYEGDIIEQTLEGERIRGLMKYHLNLLQFGVECFVLPNSKLKETLELIISKDTPNKPEVIGNIYENPELLPSKYL